MKIKIKPLVIALALPLLTGGFAALISRSRMGLFDMVSKPPLSPPAWLFPVAWTVLYVLMGVASYRVFTARAGSAEKNRALLLYGIQLAFNFFWTLIFFNLGAYWFAFFWLVALLALIAVTTRKFYGIDRPAAYLMLPYIVWVTFAGYLNLGIARMN
ncbi:MAG: tryptophan-rich sensory protein, partial [Clostridia bacterium]|nr:tryptophan-rich sensory protein [Clostridia bacterium]